MKIIVFELLVYGITNIVVFGSIFESWRNFWNKLNPSFFGKLMSCPLCLSTWVGGVLSITFSYFGYETPFSIYGITLLPLRVFLDACLSSGVCWLIHTIQEAFERSNSQN